LTFQLANQEARRLNQRFIGTEHVLLGIMTEGTGIAAGVLQKLGITLVQIRQEVERIAPPQSAAATLSKGKLPLLPNVKKAAKYAVDAARSLNHNDVGAEHLLLGILHDHNCRACKVLMSLGLNLADLKKEVLKQIGRKSFEGSREE